MDKDFDQIPMPDALPDNVHVLPGSQPHKPTEISIARAFVDRYADTMKYDHNIGAWFQWAETHWHHLYTPVAFDVIQRMTEIMTDGERAMCKASVAGGIERIARSTSEIAVLNDLWDNNPWLLGTPSGIINLKNGKLQKSKPELHITKLTGVEPQSGEPAQWLKFLSDTTRDDAEMITYLQRISGYFLTGAISEHALFFIYGSGGNGKSVFLNTLIHILGDYALSAPMDTFASAKFNGHPTELAMLKGARLVTASETEEGRAWNESRIKALTGGDPVSARFMRQDFFTYKPQFKLCFAGNHQPTLNGVDPAMRRRFNMLPFNFKPLSPDYDLEDKLKAEAPQILAWMIHGCLEWQKLGLGMPEAVAVATNDYFNEQDLLSQWIEEKCNTTPEQWDNVSTLFNSYSKYARDAGEIITSRTFGSLMRKRGFKPEKSNGIRRYRGVALKQIEQRNYDD